MNPLPSNLKVLTPDDLSNFWEDMDKPGTHYVEVDCEGDARFVGPMTEHQANVIEFYHHSGEAEDYNGTGGEVQKVNIITTKEYAKLMEPFDGEDPMRISLNSYIDENEDLEDFLRNR